jgi:hypothetical protein
VGCRPTAHWDDTTALTGCSQRKRWHLQVHAVCGTHDDMAWQRYSRCCVPHMTAWCTNRTGASIGARAQVREPNSVHTHSQIDRYFPRGAQSPPGQRARDTTAKAGGTQVDPVNNTPNIFSRETPHTRARKRACDTPRHPPDRCHRSPSHGGRSPRLSSPSQAAATGQVSEASSPSQRPPSPPPALQPTARGNQPPSLPQARNQTQTGTRMRLP